MPSTPPPARTATASRTFIKLCGFVSPLDVEAALKLDIDAVGFVFAADAKSPLRPALVRDLLSATAGSSVQTVGVIGAMAADECQRIVELGIDVLQWVVPRDAGANHPALAGEQLGRPVLPVFFDAPGLQARIQRLRLAARYDGSSLGHTVCVDGPRGGGRGVSPDWARAAQIAREVPLTLAGGLRPENVAAALAAVRPRGVDVSSGIEAPNGRKDPGRMAAFVAAVRGFC